MDKNTVSKLSANRLFKNVEAEEVKKIPEEYIFLKDFKPDQLIIEENSPAGNLFLILRGSVKVTKEMPSGKKVHIATRNEGDIFGELGVLGHDKTTTASVYAVSSAEIAIIEPNELSKIFEAIPATYSNIVDAIIEKLKRSDGTNLIQLGHLKKIKDLYRELESAKLELEKRNEELRKINIKIEMLNSELKKKNTELYRTAITDKLTGIHNRAYVMDSLIKEFSRAKRQKSPLSCVMLDIDDFKKCNDEHGHLIGDEVLKKIAGVIFDGVRKEDTAGRFGGEEFLMILPNTDEIQAGKIAEKIRKKISALEFNSKKSVFRKTISLGIAEISKTPGVKNEDELLFFADKAMYEAKRRGKNCAVLYSEII